MWKVAAFDTGLTAFSAILGGVSLVAEQGVHGLSAGRGVWHRGGMKYMENSH